MELSSISYAKMYYSQDGEDAVLAAFIENIPNCKGFYIDLGSHHPFKFSNTQYFYDRGWRGINIDATPGSMSLFNEYRREDINIEIGVSSSRHDLMFYIFEESALNSFNKKLSEDRIKKGWKLIEKKVVKTVKINDLLSKYLKLNQKIDFMNIDIEGMELDILKNFNWKDYAPDYLMIEELSIVDKDIIGFENSDLYCLLKIHHYSIVARTRRTLIFKHNADKV